MSIAINKQKNQPSITSIRIREVEKPRVKIKIQTTPNNKGKTMQKFHSNKLFMDKKHASINITPKNKTQSIQFNIEEVHSVKNGNKQLNHNGTISYLHNKKPKTAHNIITHVQRGSFSQSKPQFVKFKSFNSTTKNSTMKNNIFVSPPKKTKTIEDSKKTSSMKSSIKKRNKKTLNVNIDIGSLTEQSNKYSPSANNLIKKHKSMTGLKENNNNTNIKIGKEKKHSKTTNKYNLTINTNTNPQLTSHHSYFIKTSNSKRKTMTTTNSTNSTKLLHNNNNGISIVGIAQSMTTSSNKTLHKYNTNMTHLTNRKIGFSNTNGLNYINTMNHNSSTITNLSTTSKASRVKNLFLNNSYDNFSFSASKQASLSISTSLQTNTFKQKMKIKVNRKAQNFETTIPSRITSISLNKNNSLLNYTKQNTTTISNKYVLYRYHKYLNEYEMNELKKFKEPIYFLGLLDERKKTDLFSYVNLNKTLSHKNVNEIDYVLKLDKSESDIDPYRNVNYSLGVQFDDIEGDYILNPGDQIYYRYEIICLLGKGSYGEAVKCYDHKTKEYVCIKIIKSNRKFYNQAMIEIKLLEFISKNDIEGDTNIVKFYSHFKYRNHICLVFELLDINLYEYLKEKDFEGIDIKKIRSYATEILFALLFLKRHKIIHCDLKPENILLLKHSTNSVKVIDFGSSCFDKEKMYAYIQSRFYRAPEVILEQGYSVQIDMWSFGCILCELFTGVPIFPGEDERDQLNYMMEYLDVPPIEYINMSLKKDVFFDKKGFPFQIPNSNGKIRMPHTKTFQHFLKGAGETFIDFIKKCLKWYPEYRMTPEDALLHKFIIGDMSPEALYQHKQKIKRIKCGILRQINSSKAKTNLNSNRSGKFSMMNTIGNSSIRRNSDSTGKSYKYKQLKFKNDIIEHHSTLSHPTSLKNINKHSYSSKKDKRGIPF